MIEELLKPEPRIVNVDVKDMLRLIRNHYVPSVDPNMHPTLQREVVKACEASYLLGKGKLNNEVIEALDHALQTEIDITDERKRGLEFIRNNLIAGNATQEDLIGG